MRRRIKHLAKELERARMLEREAITRGSSAEQRRLHERVLNTEEVLISLIGAVEDERFRQLLKLKFVDGMAPRHICFILGMSRSSYYRRLKGW